MDMCDTAALHPLANNQCFGEVKKIPNGLAEASSSETKGSQHATHVGTSLCCQGDEVGAHCPTQSLRCDTPRVRQFFSLFCCELRARSRVGSDGRNMNVPTQSPEPADLSKNVGMIDRRVLTDKIGDLFRRAHVSVNINR